MQNFIKREQQALPLRFAFANWGWKWLYLAAFLADIGIFIYLMVIGSDPRGLFGTMFVEPWLLWLFCYLGAQIALVGALIWEDAPLHCMNRWVTVAVYYVLGSFWLFVYLLLRAQPAQRRAVEELKIAKSFALAIALATLALTAYLLLTAPLGNLFALWQRYPGNLYYAADILFNMFFAAPLLCDDARRRGVAMPMRYLVLMFIIGPFGLALWLWQRPPLEVPPVLQKAPSRGFGEKVDLQQC